MWYLLCKIILQVFLALFLSSAKKILCRVNASVASIPI